jgi:glyoxylase-like metal-dependent hydrolase (beta-lactamase superfamily II)
VWCTLVRAKNPGPMTLEGTNTYVLRAPGAGASVVVDPGPLEPRHLRAVAAAAGPQGVALVLLTHGHPDHAEGAQLFREMTGAPVAALLARLSIGTEPLRDGSSFPGVAGLDLRVLATPGHTSDSVSVLVQGSPDGGPALLTGDTVLGRGSTVVAHPDGRLGPYLDSLARIRDLGSLLLLPGHGPVGADASASAAAYLAHRRDRLEQVRAARAAGDRTPQEVVRRVYADVDEVLWPAAERSVRAQLEYLDETR